MTAITALTAQNTQGVQDVHQIPIAFLEKTIKAVVEDIGVDVVKTGMLPSKECIKAVCEAVDRYKIERIVVDPVSKLFIPSLSETVLILQGDDFNFWPQPHSR